MKSSIHFLSVSCMLIFNQQAANAQTYNAVDWGTYLNDNAHFPNFNYNADDLVDQIVVDNKDPESIYVVSQSKAPPKIDVSTCSANKIIDLGGGDGYVAKYNRCGELIWSTYMGDFIQCIALDEENGQTVFYVAGKKGYVVNPVDAFACDGNPAPVFQLKPADKNDAFIAKYADNGASASLLRWTYFGGKAVGGSKVTSDNILSIAISNNRVFVAGDTKSSNLDTLAQHVGDEKFSGGGGDAFFAEFDNLLSTLRFFTYVGDKGNDRCHDLKIFDNGTDPIDIFISGTTDSPLKVASGSGFDLTYNSGTDAFLCKWEDDDHDGLLTQTWGTYVGGNMYDHGRQTAVDQDGNVFFTLWGQSDDLPVTEKAYDKDFGIPGQSNNGSDVSIFKINNNGSLMTCTYFGGSKDETVNGLVILRKQSKQFVVISGLTKSPGSQFFLQDPIQDLLNGDDSFQNYDAFIAVLNDPLTTTQKLIYSTYLGGSGMEGFKTGASYHPSIAPGPRNELYFSMATVSADINSVIDTGFQDLLSDYNGGSDAFIAKLINLSDANQYDCPSLAKTNNNNFLVEDDQHPLVVYPNPFGEQFILQYYTEVQQTITVQIFNAFGKLIGNKQFDCLPGINKFDVELKHESTGVYLISIQNDDRLTTHIVMKQ